jgi:regulatory protein
VIAKKNLSKEQALQKVKHFCAYQERCHSEVREKLYQLGVRKKEHDEIIAALIGEEYLNEERFAIAYAGGRFRLKQWGRRKIRAELERRKISDYCIGRAMKQIDEGEYLQTLKKVAAKKYTSLKKEPYLIRKKKTIDYLLMKGYEPELVREALPGR